MSNLLIAVMTCGRDREANQFQRDTWALTAPCDVRFFLGGERPTDLREDELWFPVGDKRNALSNKVQALLQWALDHNYTHIFKCDHDTYVRPERLLALDYDYIGNDNTSAYAYGGPGYLLSAKAAKVVASARIDEPAEDVWVGKVLTAAGIPVTHDPRFKLIMEHQRNCYPLAWNQTIAVCEFAGKRQYDVHRIWTDSVAKSYEYQRLAGLNTIKI